MSELKISCLSIDCPERTGGICRWDPRTPIAERPVVLTAWQKAWTEVEDIIKEFGAAEPEDCIAIITEHMEKALHGREEFQQ